MVDIIRFDIVKNIPYNILEKRFITWLRIINAKTFEELKKYSNEDKIISDVQKFVAEWNTRSAKGGFERYLSKEMQKLPKKLKLKAKKLVY